MKKLRYYIRSSYGRDRRFPADHAEEILALTGKTTISDKHFEALKGMGFEMVLISEMDIEK
jgi:hypothetical protein